MCNTPLVLYIQWLMTRDPRPQKGTVAKATAPFFGSFENHAIVAWFRKAYSYAKKLPM